MGRIPFFQHYCVLHKAGMQECYQQGMHEIALLEDEMLFARGADATCVYFPNRGELRYVWQAGFKEVTATLTKEIWIAEPAIWLQWSYCGTACSKTPCDVVALKTSVFRQIAQKDATSLEFARRYGK